MSRLVRIDRRVFDDGLAGVRGPARGQAAQAQARREEGGAVEEHVEIAVRRGLDARNAGERADPAREILGDGPRRPPEPPGQLEGDGRAHVAERAVRGLLDRDRHLVGSQAVGVGEDGAHTVFERVVKRQDHACRFVDSTEAVQYAYALQRSMRAMSAGTSHSTVNRGHG